MRPFRLINIAVVAAAFIFIGPAAPAAEALKAQSSAGQGVTVKVVPRDLSPEARTWVFDLSFDTHTQPLTDDPARTAVLIVDGKRYPPTSWQGDAPGGHHRRGVLSFVPVSPRPQVIELQLQRSGEPAARSFRWSLP